MLCDIPVCNVSFYNLIFCAASPELICLEPYCKTVVEAEEIFVTPALAAGVQYWHLVVCELPFWHAICLMDLIHNFLKYY